MALDVRTEHYLATNASGAALWAMLAEGAKTEALEAHLCTMYGLAEHQARTDVAAFLDALSARDLLEP